VVVWESGNPTPFGLGGSRITFSVKFLYSKNTLVREDLYKNWKFMEKDWLEALKIRGFYKTQNAVF